MPYYQTVHKSHVQGAENGPELQFSKSSGSCLKQMTPNFTQLDAWQPCPALIVLKEENNNNNNNEHG